MRRWPGRIRDAGGSRTHEKLLCRQPPYRLAPAPRHSASSPGVEPGLRPSQSRVRSATLRGHSFQCPAEESNLVRQFRGLPCSSGTPAGRSFKCLDQDLNLDLDLRRVLCDPLHHRDVYQQYPDLESNQVQGFRKAQCDPLHHRDNQTRADDWICTSMERFTGPPPFSIEPRRQNKQECEESNPITRLWRPLPLPGGHSVSAPGDKGRGLWRNINLSAPRSSTLR